MAESVEIRWFGAGELPGTLHDWCQTAGAEFESRRDEYYVPSPEIGIKVRAREKVELKHLIDERPWEVPRELAGLELAGTVQRWAKWALPLTAPTPEEIRDSSSWHMIEKHRLMKKFEIEQDGDVRSVQLQERVREGCDVEVVEIRHGPDLGSTAWSFAFESFGSPALVARNFKLVSKFLFKELQPPLTLSLRDSASYPHWISQTLQVVR